MFLLEYFLYDFLFMIFFPGQIFSLYGSRNAYITTKWQALPPMTKRWKIS